jgi:hypothetical protein
MNAPIKKGGLGLVVCFMLSVSVLAQDRRERHEQIEAIKVAYITNKLDLTTEEAQKFWPIYNSYQKEWMELIRKKREARNNKNADPNELINTDLDYDSKMLELRKKYKKLYLKAISSQKILALYQAEREFREHLIQQLNKRRKGED